MFWSKGIQIRHKRIIQSKIHWRIITRQRSTSDPKNWSSNVLSDAQFISRLKNGIFWNCIFWDLPLVFLIFFYLPATKSCHQILFSFELALLLAAFQMPFYFLTRLQVDCENWDLKNHVNILCSYSSFSFAILLQGFDVRFT